MTIDAPDDVEVYVDGSYVGITPISFAKSEGIHVITLRKNGYETKSYTINIENASTNESMSFSELIKEEVVVEEDEEAESTASENERSVSQNSVSD